MHVSIPNRFLALLSGRRARNLIGLMSIASSTLAIPPKAVSEGVDLSWDDCVFTSSSKFFACSGVPNESYNLIIQFTSPVPVPSCIRIVAVVELVNETPGPLSPFWHYESGGCNRSPTSGVQFSDNIDQAGDCSSEGILDPWNAGTDGLENFLYFPDSPTAGHGRFILIDDAGAPISIEPFQKYYAFHLRFNNSNRVTCPGCSQPGALKLVSLNLESNDGSPPVQLDGPDVLGDCVSINGASGFTCLQACSPAPETCDGSDNDCDLTVDDVVSYRDADGDGYGDGVVTSVGCPIPSGYVPNAGDCDDTSASIHPGVADICDGLDNDCDGPTDEGAFIPNGIVGWWKGEGNANDAIGSRHGTPQNGATFVSGTVGQCFSLDGIDDYIDDLGTSASFSFVQNTGLFTIECWIGLDDPNAPREQTIAANIFSSADKGFYFGIVNSGGQHQLQMALGRGGTLIIDSRSPNGVITTPTWHHVAAVGDGTNVTFYVDGVGYAGSGNMGALSSGNGARAVDLGWDNVGSFFGGQLDELAIYSRALDASEIGAIYNAGAAGRCAIVSVEGPRASAPTLELVGPWPNPASRGLDFEIQLSSSAEVDVWVLDVMGRRVTSLLEGSELPAGPRRVHWDGRDASGQRVAPGVYLVRISAGGKVALQKVLMTR